jgi:hypothetical protein
MNRILILVFSILLSVAALLIERLVGIGWDFHPDSVTYATISEQIADAVIDSGYTGIFNNGYYLWAAAFGMNITLLTTINIFMYSFTNVLLYNFHNKYKMHSTMNYKFNNIAVILLIFNPYRLHLSTTLLKDTFIITLLVILISFRLRYGLLNVFGLISLRIASALYFIIFLPRKYLLLFLLFAMLSFSLFNEYFVEFFLRFNSSEMQLREFDSIPTFQEYGIVGVLVRGAIWPILAVTGAFALVSPAAAFFPVALGSIMTQLYCLIMLRRLSFPLAIFIPMAAFASLVTGYTSYIRYVYPLMIALPLLAIQSQKGIYPSRKH